VPIFSGDRDKVGEFKMKVENRAAPKRKGEERLRFYIETYGCQMNEYDSELVRSILLENRFDETGDPEEADVILLNTCSVRETAHNRVFGRLQSLDSLRAKGGKVVVGVLGCMAQSLKMDLLENSIYVDLIAGPDSYRSLPSLVKETMAGNGKRSAIDLSEFETYDDIYPSRLKGINAWIAVMRGCDNFCTFCIVPYARGRERSRSVESITEETRKLVGEGYSQVTLLGQNVNSYSHGGRSFADLMNAVSEVEGIKRIRFTSPHPKDFPDDLIECVTSNPKVCKHIHLPLQAGSDRILKMMNRNYDADGYIRLVVRLRDRIPDLVLTTDIILGFPTETREEYEETVNMVEKIGFDSAFIFNYSERKGTVAARRWKDDVPPKEKKYRITRLNEIQREISLEKNRRHIGQVSEILVEGPSKRDPDEWYGRTDGHKMVVFPRTGQKAGDYIPVKITGAIANTLKGDIIKSA
jgi:tRNA-2-methylthio-N6-dimethylallyladenosine synthase